MHARGRTHTGNNLTQAQVFDGLIPMVAATMGINEQRACEWTYVFAKGKSSSFHKDQQTGETFIACIQ
eukprot:5031226-Amphidinium_carterae.1